MPVFFYLDPELATDWNCRNVDDITLSYMFHRVRGAMLRGSPTAFSCVDSLPNATLMAR